MPYTVKYGDTLWSIAKTHYGNPFLWKRIWCANKEAIIKEQNRYQIRRERKMTGPDWIFPGLVLNL